MGSYTIEFTRSAEKDLRKLDRQIIPRVLSAIEDLQTDPRPVQSRKLVGSDHTHRIRVGDYRVIYNIEDTLLVVSIERIRHRKDAYS